jgi:hypothetical protein
MQTKEAYRILGRFETVGAVIDPHPLLCYHLQTMGFRV